MALLTLAGIALIPGVLVPLYGVIPPVSTVMLYARLTDGPIERQWVVLDDIAKPLVIAVMASEDARFCEHHGVDWRALDAVIDEAGGPTRGASTIAMQVARNLFLWTPRSYVRKGLEIPLALYGDRRAVMRCPYNNSAGCGTPLTTTVVGSAALASSISPITISNRFAAIVPRLAGEQPRPAPC
jgi:hypothetical protein